MVSYLRPDDSQLLQRELEPAILWVLDLENDRAVGATDPLMDGVRAEVSEETEETVEAAVVEEAEEAVEAAVAEAVEAAEAAAVAEVAEVAGVAGVAVEIDRQSIPLAVSLAMASWKASRRYPPARSGFS